MIQRNKKQIIITSIITLLPILAGLLLWQKLPDTIATHFDAQGVANGFSSKAGTVFTIFPMILGCHLLCVFVTAVDPRRRNISDKLYRLMLWICPIISMICGVSIYGNALGYKGLNGVTFPQILMGVIFLVVGNYLPKSRQNYTMGIKLPWTLDNEENWNHTHRLAGKVWIAGGIGMFIAAFLRGKIQMAVILGIIIVMVLVPTIYSFVFYLKNRE